MYRAFGELVTSSGTTVHPYLYLGRWGYSYEPDLTNYYVRARWYGAAIGRWWSRDPIGFAGGEANLYRYLGNGPTASSDPSGLYDSDVHFYLTYYLALCIGPLGTTRQLLLPLAQREPRRWPQAVMAANVSEAYLIAWSNQFTDVYSKTKPFSVGKNSGYIREAFHFPVEPGKTVVQAGSNASQTTCNAGVGSRDPILFGIGLHTFQDSWSHAGFGPGPGI